jgi:hypothetical protein
MNETLPNIEQYILNLRVFHTQSITYLGRPLGHILGRLESHALLAKPSAI